MTSARNERSNNGDDTAPRRVACQETEWVERQHKIFNEIMEDNNLNIFEIVKDTVTVRQAAEHYGLNANHSHMACCPFHNDRHPSLKLNEDYFYCFGCGANGDVIDFAAKLFGLSSYEAAQKLACDFGINLGKPLTVVPTRKPRYSLAKEFQKQELHCQRVLCDYLHLLDIWKVEHSPKTPEDTIDDRFAEACQMLDWVEELLDVLTFAGLEVRAKAVDMLRRDGTIDRLEERLNRLRKEVDAYGEAKIA